ncbi:hypothetical protein PZ897_14330, partial [Hoeflea sp. YIM 152468]|uniref:hypothetical protein n=1 Tax=Hoeflea sp. YIM 152468 TaxID=3031759 RepID=UPI0023D9B007
PTLPENTGDHPVSYTTLRDTIKSFAFAGEAARRPADHKLKVAGSNPAPATKSPNIQTHVAGAKAWLLLARQLVVPRTIS